MSQRVIGIDYGVSTTVAVVAGAEVEVVVDARGRGVFPSIVALTPNGRAVVGEAAKERRVIDPANTLHSVKRIIGEHRSSRLVQQFIEQHPYFTLERLDDGVPRFATRQGLKSAVEVSAMVLAHVMSFVKTSSLELAVVGVPTAFNERQKRATREAVRQAGIEEVLCVTEPLAVAWSQVRQQRKPDRRLAIYDLGGGTFDLAICELRGGGVGLLASGGDEQLGGDDIDQLLADWVVEQVLRRHQWDLRTSPEAMGRLLVECEQAKIELTTQERASIDLQNVEETDLFEGASIEVEQALFEDLCASLVRRTFAVCDEVLAKAKVRADELDEIHLAGGSTNIPFVQRAVKQYFGQQPLVALAPEHLVARGAAEVAMVTLGR